MSSRAIANAVKVGTKTQNCQPKASGQTVIQTAYGAEREPHSTPGQNIRIHAATTKATPKDNCWHHTPERVGPTTGAGAVAIACKRSIASPTTGSDQWTYGGDEYPGTRHRENSRSFSLPTAPMIDGTPSRLARAGFLDRHADSNTRAPTATDDG